MAAMTLKSLVYVVDSYSTFQVESDHHQRLDQLILMLPSNLVFYDSGILRNYFVSENNVQKLPFTYLVILPMPWPSSQEHLQFYINFLLMREIMLMCDLNSVSNIVVAVLLLWILHY